MGWNVVKEDERYVVTDNDTLKNLITSITELNPFHSTSGHSHAGQEEVYNFVKGSGQMKVDEDIFPVNEGDVILIEDGKFHQVINNSEKLTPRYLFLCVNYESEIKCMEHDTHRSAGGGGLGGLSGENGKGKRSGWGIVS